MYICGAHYDGRSMLPGCTQTWCLQDLLQLPRVSINSNDAKQPILQSVSWGKSPQKVPGSGLMSKELSPEMSTAAFSKVACLSLHRTSHNARLQCQYLAHRETMGIRLFHCPLHRPIVSACRPLRRYTK